MSDHIQADSGPDRRQQAFTCPFLRNRHHCGATLTRRSREQRTARISLLINEWQPELNILGHLGAFVQKCMYV